LLIARQYCYSITHSTLQSRPSGLARNGVRSDPIAARPISSRPSRIEEFETMPTRPPKPRERTPLMPVSATGRKIADRAARVTGETRSGLTSARRFVLEVIASQARAVGAYELLDLMARSGGSAHPPTVYRALDYLVEHGLVHRINVLNAYVACDHPGEAHASQLLVCRDCGRVSELDLHEIDLLIDRVAKRKGFLPEAHSIEVEGLCAPCGKLAAAVG
jgi:Fur family transcriptional regulator, zinc uptake regulator